LDSVLAGSGNGRDGLALSESARLALGIANDDIGCPVFLERPAPLAAGALRVARDRPFRAVCLQ